MPLPRYSLDDGADADEETFEESYTSNAASSSRFPSGAALHSAAAASSTLSQTPSISGRRSLSPSSSAYDAPSSLDIDALLNSTTDPSRSTKPSSRQPPPVSTGWPYSSTSPIARLSAFEQLTHFLSTQKASPEILPFPTTSFDTLVSQMEQQQSILDSLLHLNDEGEGVDEDEYLRLNLVQVDLERCKWLLKQVVRCRLDLLQKYAAFVQGRGVEREKLNASERAFVEE